MAYSYGIATDVNDLLSDIRDFLLANGWTEDAWADDNSTYRTPAGAYTTGKRLHVHKADAYSQTMYINLRSSKGHAVFESSDDTTLADGKYDFELHGLAVNGSTAAYSGALAWDKQSGHPQCGNGASWGGALWAAGSVNYWINQVGDTVNIVVEDTSDHFSFISFGSLLKTGAGSYTGGLFFSGSFSAYHPWEDFRNNSYEGRSLHLATMTTQGGIILTGSGQTAATSAVYVSGLDGVTGWVGNNYRYGDNINTTSTPTLAIVWSGISPNYTNTYTYQTSKIGGLACEGSPNNLASVTPMYPLYAFALHQTNAVIRFLGSVEGIRQISMDALNNKAEITLGSDTWKCFAARRKTSITYPWGIPGFAILIS